MAENASKFQAKLFYLSYIADSRSCAAVHDLSEIGMWDDINT